MGTHGPSGAQGKSDDALFFAASAAMALRIEGSNPESKAHTPSQRLRRLKLFVGMFTW